MVQFKPWYNLVLVGGAVASWLVCLSQDRAVRVWALAGDIVLCSWARHFTLTVPLSTQEYKCVPWNCRGNLTNCWGVTCDGLAPRPGGVEILLAASCYRIQDKLRQLWASPGSKASLRLLLQSGLFLCFVLLSYIITIHQNKGEYQMVQRVQLKHNIHI